MSGRPRLLFVSPRYLLPTDSGGKIRTANILRGLKGGRFEILLAMPAPAGALDRDREALAGLADRCLTWPEPVRGPLFALTRMRHLASPLPVAVATDRSAAGSKVVAGALADGVELVVADFPHAAVLLPERWTQPSAIFTHNVEAEIFRRHAEVASNTLRRLLWRDQTAKMERFERATLARFDTVIAVSERDARHFASAYGVAQTRSIPTGVDLDYFAFQPQTETEAQDREATLVFTGAMDWLANIDGIEFLMNEIWPQIAAAEPAAKVLVVGRNPPERLVEAARRRALPWTFTGFVDDIRPYVHASDAYLIPLRIGSGTRIKAYEAMAMGCPVVSTTIGVEGLPLDPDHHYLRADSPGAFASAVVRLLADRALRRQLARAARDYVQSHFGWKGVATAFEGICASVQQRATR